MLVRIALLVCVPHEASREASREEKAGGDGGNSGNSGNGGNGESKTAVGTATGGRGKRENRWTSAKLAAAVAEMMTKYVVPGMPAAAVLDRDQDREVEIYTREVNDVLTDALPILRDAHRIYSSAMRILHRNSMQV
jgi:hypothetical protein